MPPKPKPKIDPNAGKTKAEIEAENKAN